MSLPPLTRPPANPNRLDSALDQPSAPEVPAPPDPEKRPFRFPFSISKVGPAFWTVACIFSLVVNIILVAVLFGVGKELFFLKNMVSTQLVDGLYGNFVKMDESHIVTTILVSDTLLVKDTIPVVFDLPLAQNTEVVLTDDTPVSNATIYLNGSAVPLDLVLKKGTRLGIALNLTVPVSQTVPVVLNVPVRMNVPVDIALDQTDLHAPFVGLQNVVSPFRTLFSGLPSTWQDAPICGKAEKFCMWYFK
jgi:hypothetical protein